MAAKGEPCLHYEPKFEENDVPEARLEATVGAGANAVRQKAWVMKFSGAEGVEGLFITHDMFEQAVSMLGWNNGPARFNGFAQCLKGPAWKTWNRMVSNINNNARTNARFNQEYTALVLIYAQSSRAKDIMQEYLTHGSEIGKKYGADNRTHVDRIEALCEYSNRLPGSVPHLNDVQIRAIIIRSFPTTWVQAFERANLDENNTTTEQVIEYMNKMKANSDQSSKTPKRNRGKKNTDDNDSEDHDKSGKKNKRNRGGGGRGGGNKNNNRNKQGDGGNYKGSKNCTFPRCKQKGLQHNWYNCWWNPDGPNYQAMNSGGRRDNQNSGGGGGYRNNNNNNQNNRGGGRGQNNQGGGGNRQEQHYNEGKGGRSKADKKNAKEDDGHHFDHIGQGQSKNVRWADEDSDSGYSS